MGYADERELEFSIERFAGIDQGMEGNDTPMACSPNAFNCDTSGGLLRLAEGWALDEGFGEAPGEIRTLMRFCKFEKDGTKTEAVLAATDGGVYRQDGLAWVNVSGANPIRSGRFSWINYQKGGDALLILANGEDPVYCWKGEGDLLPLAAPAPWAQGMPEADGSKNMIRLARHGLADGDLVVFYNHEGSLPSGITELDTYFVIGSTPDTFRVSAKLNGPAVNLKTDGTAGWRVSRAKWLCDAFPAADAGTDLIHAPNHGLNQDDKVIFDNFQGSLPGGVRDNKTYYALVESPDEFRISNSENNPEDAVDILSPGTSSGWNVRKADPSSWLTGAPAVNTKTGIFTLTNHGLKRADSQGIAVEFGVNAAAVLPGGIEGGTEYFAYPTDIYPYAGCYFRISATENGPAVDISSNGHGGWAVRKADESGWIAGTASANAANNLIKLQDHGLAAGDKVVFGVPDESSFLPLGLRAGIAYFAKVIDASTIQLLTSPGATNAVDLLDKGFCVNTGRACSPRWSVKKAGATAWMNVSGIDPVTDKITVDSHNLVQGDAVELGLDPGKFLPVGLHAETEYFVVQRTTDTFALSTAKNGPAMNLTGGNTGWRIRPKIGVWKAGLPSYNSATDTIVLPAHGFANGDIAVVGMPDASSFLPEGILAHDGTPDGKYYYAVKATESTFMVAEKADGTPIVPKSTGSSAYGVRLSNENRPAGNSLALHCERVWCAGEKSQPNAVFFSDDMDPTNWALGEDAAGAIKHPTWDGDAVTAVANLFDCVTVFKGRSMFRVLGTNPGEYTVAPLAATTGTLSPATICQWQGLAFFLSPEGIMAFDGTNCKALGGDALQDFYATVTRAGDSLGGACATVVGKRLLLALPAGKDDAGRPAGQNNTVAECDLETGALMLRTGVAVDSWLPGEPLRFASGRNVCIWGEDGEGNAVQTYGGAPIPLRWETPRTDMGSRTSVKTVTGVAVTGRGGELKITVTADGRSAQKTVTLPEATATVRAGFHSRGRLVSLAFENGNGSGIEISGVTVRYEEEED